MDRRDTESKVWTLHPFLRLKCPTTFNLRYSVHQLVGVARQTSPNKNNVKSLVTADDCRSGVLL